MAKRNRVIIFKKGKSAKETRLLSQPVLKKARVVQRLNDQDLAKALGKRKSNS